MVLENFLIDVDVLWDRAGKELYEKPDARAGRKMRVRVTNKGLVEDLTGYALNLGWRSTIDETKFGLDAFTAVDITKGIFELPYTSGMLTNIGTLLGTLQLVPPAGTPTESNNFMITVKRSGVDVEAIQSENSFTALETALVEVQGWNARIDDVEQQYIDKANNLDATYPTRLVSVEQQLEQTQQQKADKTHVWNMANMGQDIKESMTGGSVAVVDGNSVNLNNFNIQIQNDISGIVTIDSSQYILHSDSRWGASDGTLVSGATGFSALELNVVAGSRVYISGIFGHSRTYAILFIKADGTVKSLINDLVSTAKLDHEILIPSETVKLKISLAASGGCVVKGRSYTSIANKKQVDKIDGEIELLREQIEIPYVRYGKAHDNVEGVATQSTSIFYNSIISECSENDELYVNFTAYTNANMIYVHFTDENLNVIKSELTGYSVQTIVTNHKLIVPIGASKIIVNTYVNTDAFVTKYTIKKDTRIKFNSNNVYTFINRESTLNNMPELTDIATKNAIKKGYNYIRASVRFTSDDVPVLLHDSTINRTARNLDGSSISTTINIADITYQDTKNYDFGIYKNYPNTEIGTVENFIRICAFAGVRPTLEVKPTIALTQATILNDIVVKFGITNKTTISSDILSNLNLFRDNFGGYDYGFICHPTGNNMVDVALNYKTDNNNVRVDIFDYDTLSNEFLNYASKKHVGIKIGSCYTLESVMSWIEKGVTILEVANVEYVEEKLRDYILT